MKKLMKVLPVVFVVVLTLTNVFAVSTDFDLSGGEANSQVTGLAKNVWATVSTIVQILAIAAVVFAGLRYMFASADTKADIKKSMGILVVGAILVFAATTIVKVVANVGNDVIGGTNSSAVQVVETEKV